MSSPSPARSVSRGRSRTPARPATAAGPNDAHSNGIRDDMDEDNERRRSLTPRSRSYTRSRSRTRTPTRSPSSSPRPLSSKIVIEKLTKNISAAHLREIFSAYGTISELEMPLNPQFMMNKGIAYILYTSPQYAEAAIAHMHEAQLDGACINVSIVLPRRRFSRSPRPRRPPPNRFGEPHRLRDGGVAPGGRGGGGMGSTVDRAYRGGPPPSGGPPPYRSGGGRSPPPPPRGYGGRGGGYGGYRDRYDDRERYRPRSYSRSPSPPPRRRHSPTYRDRTRSPSYSRSPRRRENSPPRRRRSPSYDSYDSRSRSRDRGGRRR